MAVVDIVGYLSGLYSLEQVAVERAAADRERQRQWLGAQLGLCLLTTSVATLVSCGVLLAVSEDGDMRAAGLLYSATILAGVWPRLARASRPACETTCRSGS